MRKQNGDIYSELKIHTYWVAWCTMLTSGGVKRENKTSRIIVFMDWDFHSEKHITKQF